MIMVQVLGKKGSHSFKKFKMMQEASIVESYRIPNMPEEIARYIGSNTSTEDPLLYWKHADTFPVLQMMARDYLCNTR